MKRFLVMFLALALSSGCAPTEKEVALASLRDALADQYHECVPLGWNPVPASGTYYPGANVELQEGGVWLPAMWIARVEKSSLRRADVRATVAVLDELVQRGLVSRESRRSGAVYRLTPRAVPYFFNEKRHGTNPVAISYLCYSTIVPQRVVWVKPVRSERVGGRDRVYEAAFEWTAGPAATWANDPILRAHSIVLSPTRSPSIATFVQIGQDWSLSKLGPPEPPLGQIVDISAWPPPNL